MFRGIKTLDELIKVAVITSEDLTGVCSSCLVMLKYFIQNNTLQTTTGSTMEICLYKLLISVAFQSIENNIDSKKYYNKDLAMEATKREDGFGKVIDFINPILEGFINLNNLENNRYILDSILEWLENNKINWTNIVKHSSEKINNFRNNP